MSASGGLAGRILDLLRGAYRTCPASRRLLFKFSRTLPRLIADRAFLENEVFAYLNRDQSILDILFAGVDIYTLHYPELLPGKHVRTIDIDAGKALFAVTENHVVGSVTEMGMGIHFEPDSFDCVILNGLIGYGLDDRAATAQALAATFNVLRPGGLLIVGWNDTTSHLDFRLEELPEYRQYAAYVPGYGALNASRIEANPDPGSHHTFDFLQKPPAIRESDLKRL